MNRKSLVVLLLMIASFDLHARNLFCHPGNCFLWVFSAQARVEIHNPTPNVLRCNGNVRIQTQRGRTQFRSIFERILPGQRVFRYINSFDYRDRFTFGNGFINCMQE